MTSSDFWNNKLAAFLFDAPAEIRAGLSPVGKDSDPVRARLAHATAAAADRLPFPFSPAGGSAAGGDSFVFHHPLCGQPIEFKKAPPGSGSAEPRAEPFRLQTPAGWDEAQTARARFFVHWRKCREQLEAQDRSFAFLPADPGIPDHTVWHHMGMVSALAGCQEPDGSLRPAFLKIQIGPVQDFIAAAKSVRDLWSGSYLLSWLMAAGLKALSAEVGPDAVIFPSLYQQPLFDLHWREELWDQVRTGGDSRSVWENWGYRDREHLLVPNLPNVFLALVPARDGERLGRLVQNAIQAEWKRIASASWDFCKALIAAEAPETPAGPTAAQKKTRFDQQVGQFLQISWVAEPWPDELKAALETAARFDEGMPIRNAAAAVKAVRAAASGTGQSAGADGARLENTGLAWSAILQFTNWKLDAVRQTRAFTAWGTNAWSVDAFNNKDALNGKEEAVAGGTGWAERCEQEGDQWAALFKTDAWVGASTLVKRVWHLAYLNRCFRLRTNSRDFPMPDTRQIAEGNPNPREEKASEVAEESGEGYFAVLALDGDSIGAWISGEKTPFFTQMLSKSVLGSFTREQEKILAETRRCLSPGFHLQFSETLSHFALRVVPHIIRKFRGRLIYAGGDDVLAMLPARNALDCAVALRKAFRGVEPEFPAAGEREADTVAIRAVQPGFLEVEHGGRPQGSGLLAVPGPAADVSVGIAIAHFKQPLQDVVRAAQAAEKKAKTRLHRSAVEVHTFKRSGEILEWGCKWDSGGLELFRTIQEGLYNETISGRFPHRVCQLLTPYLHSPTGLLTHMPVPDFPVDAVIAREFAFVTSRQCGQTIRPALVEQLGAFLCGLARTAPEKGRGPDPVEAVIGLCRTVAFANRTPVHP